jgi:hypothetical protein
MRLIIFCILFCGGLTPSASGQITQDHPELCGKVYDYVSVPSNVSATLDSNGGEAKVFLKTSDSVKEIAIPGVTDEIEEVCPIAANRLVVFGNASSATHNIAFIDARNGSLVDSFYGTSPHMSPNQQWLVYRKFYARGALSPSDEYLLYDLRRTRSQNRPT